MTHQLKDRHRPCGVVVDHQRGVGSDAQGLPIQPDHQVEHSARIAAGEQEHDRGKENQDPDQSDRRRRAILTSRQAETS